MPTDTSENTIDYYFSVISPWTYMGDARLRALADKHGFRIVHHPMLSPKLFPATGGLALKDRHPTRQAYRMQELKRWTKHLGFSLNLQPKFFPAPEAAASQMIWAARETDPGKVGELANALMRAVWEEDRDIADDATLAAIADACGYDGDAVLTASKDDRYAQAVETDVAQAITRGVFGYPTYVLGEELFWGQDRLDLLERALEAGN